MDINMNTILLCLCFFILGICFAKNGKLVEGLGFGERCTPGEQQCQENDYNGCCKTYHPGNPSAYTTQGRSPYYTCSAEFQCKN